MAGTIEIVMRKITPSESVLALILDSFAIRNLRSSLESTSRALQISSGECDQPDQVLIYN